MLDAIVSPPSPTNEPVLTYAPGTPERAALKRELVRMSSEVIDIPMVIGGRAVTTGQLHDVRAPHRRELLLGKAHEGGAEHASLAIDAARRAHREWSSMPWTSRAAIFLRAADLAAGPWRARLCASTMLGQSKTAHQAEIDAACELIDFLRFNVAYYRQLLESSQPVSSSGVWNVADLRPLEGFVCAITPFNFTAIAGNLPTAPALAGNTIVWKPAMNALHSAHQVLQLLREAGLPDGVVNMVIGPPAELVNTCIDSPELAGVHFTGSTSVFQSIWRRVGEGIQKYRSYPRVVGETGGKDFVFAHPSADVDALAVALVRGAFEYQGQKCSAASRAYVPASIWRGLRERVVDHMRQIKMGDVSDLETFMGAVIDERAFARLAGRIEGAKQDSACTIVHGGGTSDAKGYFVEPTVVEVTDPLHALMRDELFGPLLSVWVYPDDDADAALAICDQSTPYALTGAIFSNDRAFTERAMKSLRFAAGNLYINDKPTGAVVGQQPFGGGRASGTNDKAGSALNLERWISPRIVKETFVPPKAIGYPSMAPG